MFRVHVTFGAPKIVFQPRSISACIVVGESRNLVIVYQPNFECPSIVPFLEAAEVVERRTRRRVKKTQNMSEGCCRIVMLAALRILDRLDGTAQLYLANDCVGQGRRRQNDSTCKICRGDRRMQCSGTGVAANIRTTFRERLMGLIS
jgi:hypothetical protein